MHKWHRCLSYQKERFGTLPGSEKLEANKAVID